VVASFKQLDYKVKLRQPNALKRGVLHHRMPQVAMRADPAVAQRVGLGFNQSTLGVAESAESAAVQQAVHRVCLNDVDYRLDEALIHLLWLES
jgi:hypothetical protein